MDIKAFTLLSAILLTVACISQSDVIYRHFWFRETIVITNNSSHVVRVHTRYLKILIPLNIHPWQRIDTIIVKTNRRIEYRITSEDNTQLIQIERCWLRPGESIKIEVLVRIKVTRALPLINPRRIARIDYELYGDFEQLKTKIALQYEKYLDLGALVEGDVREFKKFSERIAEAGEKEKVVNSLLRIVKWIMNNIKYVRSNSKREPSQVILTREGNCLEQAMLLAAMCRAAGIPSYVLVAYHYKPGYVDNATVEGLSMTFHNLEPHALAMVYVPGVGWIPVDTTFYKGESELDAVNNPSIVIDDGFILAFTLADEEDFENIIYEGEKGLSITIVKELYEEPLELYKPST